MSVDRHCAPYVGLTLYCCKWSRRYEQS